MPFVDRIGDHPIRRNRPFDNIKMLCSGIKFPALGSDEIEPICLPIGTETKPKITSYADPQAIANRTDSRALWCEGVIDLCEIVRSASDGLVGELGYSTSGLSDDFADSVSSEGGRKQHNK